MFHMKQFIDGSLKTKRSKMYYKNEPVDNYDYEDQPHEIAAREAEETLYKEYHEERLESLRWKDFQQLESKLTQMEIIA